MPEGAHYRPWPFKVCKKLDPESGADRAVEMLSWSEARERFTTAVENVQRLACQRQKIANALGQATGPDAALAALRQQARDHREYVAKLQAHRRELERDADDARDACSRAEAAVIDARDLLANAREMIDRADTQVIAASAKLRSHAASKPGFLRRMRTRNALSNWQGEYKPLADALNNADGRLRQAETYYTTCKAVLSERQRELNDAAGTEQDFRARLPQREKDLELAVSAARYADRAVRSREEEIRHEAGQLDQARRQWSRRVPGDEWNANPEDRDAMKKRETSSPWMDEEFAAARSRLFLAALHLHRAVLTAEPDLMRKNCAPRWTS